MSKKRNRPGYTAQGVKDLNYLRGPSVGKRLELPEEQGGSCTHPPHMLRDRDGIVECQCKCMWDFDGKIIRSTK